ncbi:MAG TPA: hypothetical protein DEP85_00630 [Holosporales bacterium]|nr:hypothetical protein [Candidatus Woesearchaeota archaeon]HCC24005.1 hypothetical protein [Holosporales bacterium]HIH22173.1 hypothetical protein [Candidatus Micrarchaeota archaeon]
MVIPKKRKRIRPKSSNTLWVNYGVPLIFLVLGAIISYFFTLHGVNLAFPDYPDLVVEYSPKIMVHQSQFEAINRSEGVTNNQIPFVYSIPVRLINKGRLQISEIIVSLWGKNVIYPTALIGPLRGTNAFTDYNLSVNFRCETLYPCSKKDIPLGLHTFNIYAYCENCAVQLHNYLVEFCVYDELSVSSVECIQELRYFPTPLETIKDFSN